MVNIDDIWGTICGTGWDLLDAKVLCRQAGMNHARYAMQVGSPGSPGSPGSSETIEIKIEAI